MDEMVFLLNRQLNYMSARMNKENDNYTVRLFENERTALEIFEHAIGVFYRYGLVERDDVKFEDTSYEFNNDEPYFEQIVTGYHRAIDLFESTRDKEYNEEQLEGKITLVMHTVHHVGQAMTLVNINSRRTKST